MEDYCKERKQERGGGIPMGGRQGGAKPSLLLQSCTNTHMQTYTHTVKDRWADVLTTDSANQEQPPLWGLGRAVGVCSST